MRTPATGNAIRIGIVVVGIGLLYPFQRWIDSTSPGDPLGDESLYISSGTALKKWSLGLDGLVSDVYWIRTVQYFGRKLVENGRPPSPYTADIRMDLLAPFLNIVVTLDPQHVSAYRFGAIFLPDRDPQAAIDLLERGIAENPQEWRLEQDLGFIYWHLGDFEKASESYERGSKVAGAPAWMRDMVGLMKMKGGSRATARSVYSQYLESDDANVRDQAIARLSQIQSLDEMDAINSLLLSYKEKAGACPASLRVLASRMIAMGLTLSDEMAPLDPAGIPYVLNDETCKVELNHQSPVPK
jgi:tetratricopeptide (TPR) repeat protein